MESHASSGLPESHPLAPAQESNCLVAKVLGCQRGRAGRRQAVDQWQWHCRTWVSTWAQVCSAPPCLPWPSPRAPGSDWERKFLQGLNAAGGAQYGAGGGLDPREGGSLAERLVNRERRGRAGLKEISGVPLGPKSMEGKGERTCGVY